MMNKFPESDSLKSDSSEKSLEDLIDRLAHDLRSPLRTISSYSKILKEEYSKKPFDSEGQRLLERIDYNSKRMGHLLEQLLLYVKVGKAEIKNSNVDMKALAEKAWKEAKSHYPESKIKFSIKEVPNINSDEGLIYKLLLTLFSNAIVFIKPEVESEVEFGSVEKNNKTDYYVKDNGVGFEPRYKTFIFELFQRLHSISEYEGAGIGLGIAKRIVHKLNGKIWADSELGDGATFYFFLPKSQI